jgi:hypothetical protein
VKPFSYHTPFRYTNDRERDIARARVEFHQIGDQAPYFSITGEIYSAARVRGEKKVSFDGQNWWMHSCGCQHEMIAKTFPELAPFIKWHLSAADGPMQMHYVANAVYRAQDAGDVALYQSCGDTRERSTGGLREDASSHRRVRSHCVVRVAPPRAPRRVHADARHRSRPRREALT